MACWMIFRRRRLLDRRALPFIVCLNSSVACLAVGLVGVMGRRRSSAVEGLAGKQLETSGAGFHLAVSKPCVVLLPVSDGGWKQFEVLDAVIQSIAVDVVDDLCG